MFFKAYIHSRFSMAVEHKRKACYSGHVHRALTVVLVLAQCFGQMPVEGITSTTPNSLKFTKASFRFAYSVLVLVGAAFVLLAHVLSLVKKGIGFFQVGGYVRVSLNRRGICVQTSITQYLQFNVIYLL